MKRFSLNTYTLNNETKELKRGDTIFFDTEGEAVAASKELRPRHISVHNTTSTNPRRFLIEKWSVKIKR